MTLKNPPDSTEKYLNLEIHHWDPVAGRRNPTIKELLASDAMSSWKIILQIADLYCTKFCTVGNREPDAIAKEQFDSLQRALHLALYKLPPMDEEECSACAIVKAIPYLPSLQRYWGPSGATFRLPHVPGCDNFADDDTPMVMNFDIPDMENDDFYWEECFYSKDNRILCAISNQATDETIKCDLRLFIKEFIGIQDGFEDFTVEYPKFRVSNLALAQQAMRHIQNWKNMETDTTSSNCFENVFKRQGNRWLIRFRGEEVTPEANDDGWAYIHHLICVSPKRIQPNELYNHLHHPPVSNIEMSAHQMEADSLTEYSDKELFAEVGKYDDNDYRLKELIREKKEIEKDLRKYRKRLSHPKIEELESAIEYKEKEIQEFKNLRSKDFKKCKDNLNGRLAIVYKKLHDENNLKMLAHFKSAVNIGNDCFYRTELDISWTTE